MQQPPGFIDSSYSDHVCHLKKAIYGLRQSPRAWYMELKSYLVGCGSVNSKSDASLFISHNNHTTLFLLVYVDDIIVTGNSPSAVQQCISNLTTRFSLKDLGTLSYFLGVQAAHIPHGLFLSQTKYINELLLKYNMQNSKEAPSPLTLTNILKLDDGSSPTDATQYR